MSTKGTYTFFVIRKTDTGRVIVTDKKPADGVKIYFQVDYHEPLTLELGELIRDVAMRAVVYGAEFARKAR